MIVVNIGRVPYFITTIKRTLFSVALPFLVSVSTGRVLGLAGGCAFASLKDALGSEDAMYLLLQITHSYTRLIRIK
jgi:hypothetical protein